MSSFMKISIESIKKLVEDAKRERVNLGDIINPILHNYNLEKKEILEVCQIGKFIYNLNCQISFIEKPSPPRPDFIIQYDSKLVGLEHTRIFSENAGNFNRVNSIIEYSEEVYKSMFPNDKVHAIISVEDDNIVYKQIEKKKIAVEIALYVNSVKNGFFLEKPLYIKNVKTTIHSKISFSYDEKNWKSNYLTKGRLEKEINKKEKKIFLYKKDEKEISEYWLVLFIGSLSSASYELNENEDYKLPSKFDRVYLVADFDSKIVRVC